MSMNSLTRGRRAVMGAAITASALLGVPAVATADDAEVTARWWMLSRTRMPQMTLA
ncbi:hypothetical protein [Rhodococcus sp. UFZ-B548]|uniref:hypothetical protein n=1 Tax=Rhodococcus sp. UFZ-B548 TaxID=2742212 RepID=UPI001C712506|nr:hypothetical protein [Rhodococcus sp. UFZ-B548]